MNNHDVIVLLTPCSISKELHQLKYQIIYTSPKMAIENPLFNDLLCSPEFHKHLTSIVIDEAVKTVQTSCRNSGNSGVGRSWLGLGLSLCAMPLLLIGSQRSGADRSNSETLVMSMSSR